MEPCRSSLEVKVPMKTSDIRIPLDFKDICRTCLLESTNMLQLSSKEEIEGKSCSIFEILMTSTNIQIAENDGLPNVICIHCLKSAKFVYCFKRQCVQADGVLKKFFGMVSEKKDFVEPKIEKDQLDFTFSDVDDISLVYCKDLKICDVSTSGKIEQVRKNLPKTTDRVSNDDTSNNKGGECTVCGKLVRSIRRHMMRHTSRNFTCDMCGKSYPSRYDLNNHLKTHSKERPFKCKVCLKDFCHIYRLKEHILGHENKRDYICELCGKGFNLAKQLAVHMRVHTGIKRHECSICHKNYAGSEKLKIHLRSHTGEKKFVCDYCSKAFVSKELLKAHLRIHTGEKPYSCDVIGCDRRFTTQHSLLMHKPVHSDDRPYPCLTCGKRFARVPDRRKHEMTHSSTGERYNCPQQGCLRAYTSPRRLKEHLTWHSVDKRSLCTLCGKSFTRKSDLTRHVRTHTQERPFKCIECGVGFNQQFGLTQHLRKHSGESRFICDLCGKGFNRKCSMEKHKMVHAGTRNHACDHCDMKFTDSSQLSRHKRTHTGERPYKCDMCDKAFSARSSYVVHLRAHTGERPYQCHFCDKACATSTALKIHTRYHTGEKPYACPQCGISFIRSDLRSIHMKTCCPDAVAEPLAQTPLRYYLHQKSGGLNVLQLIPQVETGQQSRASTLHLHLQGSINTSTDDTLNAGVLDRNLLLPHSSAVPTQPSPVNQLLNHTQCDQSIHQFNKS